jgi:hypothetical protein
MERISTKIKKEKALKQLVITRGNIQLTAIYACISRSQFYYWLANDEIFKKQCMEILEGINQYCFNQRLSKICKKNPKALEKLANEINKKIVQLSQTKSII